MARQDFFVDQSIHRWMRREAKRRNTHVNALWCEAVADYCRDPQSHRADLPDIEGMPSLVNIDMPQELLLRLQETGLRHRHGDDPLVSRALQRKILTRASQLFYSRHAQAKAAQAPEMPRAGRRFRL